MNDVIKSMTKEEAQHITNRIRNGVNLLRELLTEVYEREGWKVLGYSSMNEYMLTEFPDMSNSQLHRQLQAGRTLTNIIPPMGESVSERAVRPIATSKYIEHPETQKEIWQNAVEKSVNGKPTAKIVEQAKQDYEQRQTRPKEKDYITLEEWNSGERWRGDYSTNKMNKVNENIEWAGWSWNPVTGCLHNCPYCYARDIANRFYEQKFEPSFVPGRLRNPDNTQPDKSSFAGDKIFTCSMADLFGKWVPEEWINEVLETISRNPQWTFLLLTKFPVRMAEFTYPPNVWLGTSVDRQHAVHRAQSAFEKIKESGFGGVCWLSCEPMLERLTFDSLDMFDWVVMGGASKSTQTAEHFPPFDDIFHLYRQARDSDCSVYMKTNLLGERIREYPEGESRK